MRIQWIIIAKQYGTNPDTTMYIDGIFHRITIRGENNKVSMVLIAKVNINPTEVGEDKDLILEVSHDKEGRLMANHVPYKVRDMTTWANYTPYVSMQLDDMRLPYSGEYTFRLFVDKGYNEEVISVRYL